MRSQGEANQGSIRNIFSSFCTLIQDLEFIQLFENREIVYCLQTFFPADNPFKKKRAKDEILKSIFVHFLSKNEIGRNITVC